MMTEKDRGHLESQLKTLKSNLVVYEEAVKGIINRIKSYEKRIKLDEQDKKKN